MLQRFEIFLRQTWKLRVFVICMLGFMFLGGCTNISSNFRGDGKDPYGKTISPGSGGGMPWP